MAQRTALTGDWVFALGAQTLPEALARTDWQTVTVPHTWNNLDGQDGGNSYYRGAGWYRRTLTLEKEAGKVYYLEFLGVNSVADVYVNGTHLGRHRGGYTLFRFDATEALQNGENTVLVKADNSPFPDVIPLEADFTFFRRDIPRSLFMHRGKNTFFAVRFWVGRCADILSEQLRGA